MTINCELTNYELVNFESANQQLTKY